MNERELERISGTLAIVETERDMLKQALLDIEILDRRIFKRLSQQKDASDLNLHRSMILESAGLFSSGLLQ